MATIKAEVTFMVYSQNGVGRPEKRQMELTFEDFTNCTSSLGKEKLRPWAKMLFPSAKDVKIQGARKIN